MRPVPFKLERYFDRHGAGRRTLSPSDCASVSVGQLLDFDPSAPTDLLDIALGYGEHSGELNLREAIASLHHGLDADRFTVHTSGGHAIQCAMNAMLEPGDHVVAIAPAYQSLHSLPEAIGCELDVWTVQEGEFGWTVDVEELASLLRPDTKLLVINFPHNPTGCHIDRATLDAILDLARQHGTWVLSDEVFRLTEYDPADRLPPAASLYERAVSLGGLSKSFGLPGLRIGWLATQSKVLREGFVHELDYSTRSTSIVSQFLAEIALRHAEAVLERNRRIALENLAIVNAFMERHGDILCWHAPIAGVLGFPRFTIPLPLERLADALLENEDLIVAWGDIFDADPSYFRLGFGHLGFGKTLAGFERVLDYFLASNGGGRTPERHARSSAAWR